MPIAQMAFLAAAKENVKQFFSLKNTKITCCVSFPHLYQETIALNTVRTNCPLGVYFLIHSWGWITDRRVAIHCLKAPLTRAEGKAQSQSRPKGLPTRSPDQEGPPRLLVFNVYRCCWKCYLQTIDILSFMFTSLPFRRFVSVDSCSPALDFPFYCFDLFCFVGSWLHSQNNLFVLSLEDKGRRKVEARTHIDAILLPWDE